MTKEEANAEVTRLINESEENIRKAQALADEHGLTFRFDAPGGYHLSDSYKGKAIVQEATRGYYNLDDEEDMHDFERLTGKWSSSSAYC